MKVPFFPFSLIWQRHFLWQATKTVMLFIGCFYGLYVLIDISAHAGSYHHYLRFNWKETSLYYLFEFIQRIDILLPFGLLLAVIRVVCNLNANHELTALQASGYPLKALMRPFLFLGMVCTLLLMLNTEYVLPLALEKIRKIDEKHHQQKIKKQEIRSVQHVILEDDSTLLFQNYNSAQQAFFDVYWIKGIDEIYRMKYLHPYTEVPVGEFVDHLKRNQQGVLAVEQSHPVYLFPAIRLDKGEALDSIAPPEDFSLTELYHKFPEKKEELSEKEAQVQTMFYYKFVLPWLCLLAVIGPIPFCVRYTRNLPVFLIYAFALFTLLAFYLVIDAALILGERQVIPPFWAIFIPTALFFGFFTSKYLKCT